MSRFKLSKISFNSPVIVGFTIISFAALILSIVTGGFTNRLFFSVYRSSMGDPLFYVRLVGHVFGHANWQHFINNIMLILILGPLLEEKYGSLNMLFVLLATAIITGISSLILFPNQSLLGASGIVFALILLSSLISLKEDKIPITFILVVVIYMGQQVYQGLFVHDSVSNSTHIIGGIVGATLGFIMNKNKMSKY